MDGEMDSDRHPLRPPSVTRRLDIATSLTTGHLYRPGALLAVVMMLLPAALALVSAAISLAMWDTVPLVVPLLLVLWLPALLAAWLTAVSVRTTATSVAARRPGGDWQELPWALIDRAERHGFALVLKTSDGRKITFMPVCLKEGTRLYRELLMRLAVRVLDDRLRADLGAVLGRQVVPGPTGAPSGTLYAQPRAIWRWGAAGAAVALAASGAAAWVVLPAGAALPLAGACLLALSVLVGAFLWLGQAIIISEHGMTVHHAVARRSFELAWGEVQLIEHTPGERMLRVWGKRRVRCAGPALLDDTKRDLMRAFLHAYCLARGVPVVERKWLW
jgi:hypothetical protein